MYYTNLTLLTDFYELTMMQGYLAYGFKNKRAAFDLFYRSNPMSNGFSIAAGLSQAIEYISNLRFDDEDIEYLKGLCIFGRDFLEYLRGFKFSGELYAVPEGSVVFPNEPLVRVRAPIMEAQLIETALLNIINHQSLIATKAFRVVHAAAGDPVMEFGLRRAQGPDAGVYGARAAVIAGCVGTSNTLCGKMFGAPLKGTHAHSWIMSFPDEAAAFRAYAGMYPEAAILLVDTYDTLKSGVPNAIKIFGEMRERDIGFKSYGIRLDSGDLSYLSKKARVMLDEAGFKDAVISASSDLDEGLIESLKLQGCAVNLWGVGTNLITSKDCPAFGGVYKLCCEYDDNGVERPKIKLSDNPEKITNPGFKKIVRFYDSATNKIKADLIALDDERIDESEDITLFDPATTWKKMTLKAGSYYTKEPLAPIFIDGELVYGEPSLLEIQAYCREQTDSLWEEHKRLVNPHILPVDLSWRLYTLKRKMIEENSFGE
jgi:nicotinate phosphoribosyltransferase